MSYGITDEGFIPKTLSIIQDEVESALKEALGTYINTLPQSIFGQLKGIFSEREYLIWELGEDLYNSQYPDTSSGVSLDNVSAITAISRLSAEYSIIENQALFGTIGTLIPSGTKLSKINAPTDIYETINNVTLAAGVDAVQTISISTIPDNGTFKLSFNDEETSNLDYDATADELETALNNLDSLSEVSVSGTWASNFIISFSGEDGKQPQVSVGITDNLLTLSGLPITDLAINAETIIGEYQGTVNCRATETGILEGEVKTITEIDNPISGFTKTFNPEAVIAGRDEETDSELRIRRAQRLQISEAGPLDAIIESVLSLNDLESTVNIESVIGFENITLLTNTRGLPGKSFEIVVYQEDGSIERDEEIAEKILNAKPAGIESYGKSISIAVNDSQGYSHIIKFSRPDEINIWLELDVTVNDDYRIDGSQQIKDAITAWGNALGVGGNIIVYPKLISQLNNISGIEDVVIRIGIAASPTLDDNIEIDDGTGGNIEISRWHDDRILITTL